MRPFLPLTLGLLAAPAWAEVPQVLADTAPVQSLVAMVMGDLGAPGLIVRPGTSPHDASLTPSEAQALTEADLVVWTGPAFLPWLGDSLASLAPDTPTLALLETQGWDPLPLREGARLEDRGGADGTPDPHAWLDPKVAAAWLGAIAGALSEADPDNAATYDGNAQAAMDRLLALRDGLRARLATLAGRGYAVGHDAYQYLERATGLPATWALGDAAGLPPAPGTVSDLRDAVLAGEVRCLLLDTETDPAWAATLGEDATLRTAEADPEGARLEPGPDLYPALIDGLARSLEACLAP